MRMRTLKRPIVPTRPFGSCLKLLTIATVHREMSTFTSNHWNGPCCLLYLVKTEQGHVWQADERAHGVHSDGLHNVESELETLLAVVQC